MTDLRRCLGVLAKPWYFCAGVLMGVLLGVVLSANAGVDRPLPADGTLGIMHLAALPKIMIDNKEYKLTAGAQIRNEKNMIVQISTLKGQDVDVLYKLNYQNQVDRIWILTDREVQRIVNKEPVKPIVPVVVK